MSASQFDPLPMLSSEPAPAPAPAERVQPDPRRDRRGDRRARRDPVHEGHSRGARRAASRRARSRPCRRSTCPFAAVDVLPDPRIRQELSAISNWPTIPQLFVDGELVGGCDIVTEMYESGELAEVLQ